MNKKNKTPAPKEKQRLIALGVLAAIAVARTITGSGLGYIIVPLLMIFLLALLVGVLAARRLKAAGVSKQNLRSFGTKMDLGSVGKKLRERFGEHSHDLLDKNNTAEACDDDSLLHWQKQLDSFLKAGIIDKQEYNTLLNNARKNNSQNSP